MVLLISYIVVLVANSSVVASSASSVGASASSVGTSEWVSGGLFIFIMLYSSLTILELDLGDLLVSEKRSGILLISGLLLLPLEWSTSGLLFGVRVILLVELL